MDELKEYVIKLQKEYNALETKCDGSARELKNLIDMNLKAINVIQCCGGEAEQLKAKTVPTFDKYLLKFESKDRYGEKMWLTRTGFKTKESMMQIYENYITSL